MSHEIWLSLTDIALIASVPIWIALTQLLAWGTPRRRKAVSR